jgi:hypothetical protein
MEEFDYRKAYEQISRDLKKALEERDHLDAKISAIRTTITALAASCERAGIEIEHSAEAEHMVVSSSLPEEILSILRAAYPGYHRATVIKEKLEQLGHDLSRYKNPLATIHMILKRQVDALKAETAVNAAGERLYRVRKTMGDRMNRAKKKNEN